MYGEFDPAPLVFIALMLTLYVVPTVVAFSRRHPNRWPILIVNLAFGATLIGWLIALIWALHAIHRPEARGGGESGLNLFENDSIRIVHSTAFSPSAPKF